MSTTDLDSAKLTSLAARIYRDGAAGFDDLHAELTTAEGLKVVEKPKGSGNWTATMAGITGESLDSAQVALENWAAAARRAVLAQDALPPGDAAAPEA